MSDAVEHMEYCSEWPPAHVVLSQVYRKEDLKRTKRQNIDADDAMAQMGELSQMMGSGAAPLPKHLVELADWGESVKGKLPN